MQKQAHIIPKISVIMTVYNSEKYVWETIGSILAQSYKNFEFIIIDDGSSDDSYNICAKYASQDERIRLYKNEKNIWVVKTRNKLLEAVRDDTKYIAIIDADDISYPERLEKQVEFLEDNPDISLLGSDIDIIDEAGQKIWERMYPHNHDEVKKSIFQKSPLAQPASMIRKSSLDEVWEYNEVFERCQDYELWCRMFDRGYLIANLPENLTAYRVFPDQGKTKYLKLTLRNTLKIQKKYIFQRKYFSLQNLLYFLGESIISLLPRKIILWLFKKMSY